MHEHSGSRGWRRLTFPIALSCAAHLGGAHTAACISLEGQSSILSMLAQLLNASTSISNDVQSQTKVHLNTCRMQSFFARGLKRNVSRPFQMRQTALIHQHEVPTRVQIVPLQHPFHIAQSNQVPDIASRALSLSVADRAAGASPLVLVPEIESRG